MPPVPQDQRRTSPGRVFTFDTLPEKGIPFSKNHIRRLVAKGKFPAPFYLSERRPAWSELRSTLGFRSGKRSVICRHRRR
jgi:hypothetical protein